MLQTGRAYSVGSGYRYGFNGKENDNEVKGNGYQQDYGMRIYDTRLGKFLSVDPLTKDFPWYTPYQFAGNKPINSVDLDGAEEFESYSEYAKAYGANAMSESKWDGSDGAWLKDDREKKNSRWSNAMSAITEHKWVDKLKYAGSNSNDAIYPFKVTRDYYIWAQKQIDSRGWLSRWAIGASYLVDELVDSYQADNNGSEAMMGNLFAQDIGGGILKELNLGIAALAIDRYNSILYGKEKVDNTEKAWYEWDKRFINAEQSGANSPAYKVYSSYDGTNQLNKFNKLSRQEGLFRLSVTKHFFPKFSLYGGDITKKDTEWDVELRVNLPLLMIWPSTHQFYGNNLPSRFTKSTNPIGVGHAETAASAIEDWHQKQMKY